MGEDINRMSSHFEDVLIENREELIRHLRSSDITNSLFQRRVIDLDDIQEIKKEEREGRRAGVEKLLEKLHSSGSHGFDMFVESLRCNGYTTLVELLQVSYQSISNRPEEIATKTCSRLKETENRSDSGNNGVKRRGTIPKRHKKILRENIQKLMDNILIKNIIHHLFGNQLIDWNDKDAIETRLKSEGNREALNYFIFNVLYNSGDEALPKFIRCLHETGYSEIAKLLEDKMHGQ